MDLEALEPLAFSDDRDAAVQALLPGTEAHDYWRAVRLQHQGALDAVDAVLEGWVERWGPGPLHRRLERRQLLLRAGQDPARQAEALRLAASVELNDPPPTRDPRAISPSILESFDPDAVIDEALGQAPDTRHLSAAGLRRLVQRGSPLTEAQRRSALAGLQDADLPGVVELIAADLAAGPSAPAFGSLAVHQALTLEQLHQLAGLHSALRADPAWVTAVLVRMRPDASVLDRADPAVRRAWLEALAGFVSGLGRAFTALKASVLGHLLLLDRREGQLDGDRLLAWLALPRSARWVDPDRHRDVRPEHLAAPGAGLEEATGLGFIDEESLARERVEALLARDDPARWPALRELLAERWYEERLATARLLAGDPDSERWAHLLGPAALQALRDRVDIELGPENPDRWAADARVRLRVDVKNVERLSLQVFRINALAAYLATGDDVDASVDLDGLVAAHARTLERAEPPLRRTRHVLELPECDRPGTYVVELIGNGRASRALLRKGWLRHTVRVGPHGLVVHVRDEAGEPVTDATLWLGQRAFAPRADGSLLVPFTTRPGPVRALLVHGDITTVIRLHHPEERVNLRLSARLERESVVAGRIATLLLRPLLTVAGQPAPAGLLDEARVTVEVIDREDTRTAHTVEPELTDDAELPVDVRIPEDAVRIGVRLRARLRQLSTQQTLDLEACAEAEVNAVVGTELVEFPHLARSADGHALFVLGRTGEPRAHRAVSLILTHERVRLPLQRELTTDERGRIELGDLAGITALEARLSSGACARFHLRAPRDVPATLHVVEGERFHLPAPGDADIVLTRLVDGAVVAGAPDQVERIDEAVAIGPLPAGTWRLRSLGWTQDVRVVVAPAPGPGWARAGWVSTPSGQLEVPPAPPVLQSLTVGEDQVVVRILGATPLTRVHLVATRFVPAPVLDGLRLPPRAPARVPRAEPATAYLSGRDIGDEYRYVLDRRTQKRRPGTLLERPGLLLNPWALRTTTTAVMDAMGGGAWDARAAERAAPPPAAAPVSETAGPAPTLTGFVDFLPESARVLANLRPEEGQIRVPLADLGGAMHVRAVLVDPRLCSEVDLGLPEPPLVARDRRLRSAIDAAAHLVEDRRLESAPQGTALTVDPRSGRLEVVDTVRRAHEVLQALADLPELDTFRFVTRWPSLSEAERGALYSEHACHELHLFLAFKDPGWFGAVVRPYLENKRHKTFVDLWLLGQDLSAWCEPWAFGRLNAFERVLLGRRVPSMTEVVRRWLADAVELQPPDPARDARLVATVLGAGALVEEALVSGAEEVHLLAEEGAPPLGRALRAKRRGPPSRSRRAHPAEEEALFRPADRTQEWAEQDWWRRQVEDAGPELIGPNRFWRDLAAHEHGPFLSPHLGDCVGSFAEAMCALAVLELPFVAGEHAVQRTDEAVVLTLGSHALVARTELVRAEPAEGAPPILVGQRLLRADDRTTLEGGELREKYVEGPLTAGVVYVCRVVVTNPTPARERVDVLLQIPEGSVPVSGGFVTRTLHRVLPPFGTESIEYAFTFPFAGTFSHWPAHVSRGGVLLVHEAPVTWEVLANEPPGDPDAWPTLAARASTDAVLAWFEGHNLLGVDLGDLAWRMRDRDAFERITAALAARGLYVERLWAYALLHGDRQRLAEWLRHQDGLLQDAGPVLEGGLVEVEPVARGLYQHLEYAPLLHARAHTLGPRRRVLNAGLERQVRRFLELVAHRQAPSPDDWLAWAHYLFTLDRVDDARTALGRVSREEVATKLQHDWLTAYASVLDADLARAREVASRWAEHPVDRWRKRFQAILALLDEAEGGEVSRIDVDSREQRLAEQAARAPALELTVEGATVVLQHRNLAEAEVRLYGMDLELLFSRQPFVQGDVGRFALVEPLERWMVTLEGDGRTEVPLTRRANVVVEVVGRGIRRAAAVYACDLTVEVVEPWGQLRVLRASDRAALPATYVKVYARHKGGRVAFYKDGYTDIVGRFDYAGLSTDELDRVERFALLVSSDAHGSTVIEAGPPT